jgi:hypothetical protein
MVAGIGVNSNTVTLEPHLPQTGRTFFAEVITAIFAGAAGDYNYVTVWSRTMATGLLNPYLKAHSTVATAPAQNQSGYARGWLIAEYVPPPGVPPGTMFVNYTRMGSGGLANLEIRGYIDDYRTMNDIGGCSLW